MVILENLPSQIVDASYANAMEILQGVIGKQDVAYHVKTTL